MFNEVNYRYSGILRSIMWYGDELETRNHKVKSRFDFNNLIFTQTPLVTVRKTAWKKAIREMEWFLSGDNECPAELLDWWKGQLNINNRLLDGYTEQFRYARGDIHNITYGVIYSDYSDYFDQIKFILDGLKNNPNSRRLIISLWNPGEMANITVTNGNSNTPTVCHSVLMQFFVRGGKLYIKSYQRSADMLLGVPHNWIQSWAMLLYFAYHSELKVGGLIWMFGDAHVYMEDSHIETAETIIEVDIPCCKIPELVYNPVDIEYDFNGVPIFKTKDFSLDGEIPEPIVLIRPKLL